MNKYLNLKAYCRFFEKKLFGWQRIYSQCGEDLILDMLINKASGFYVDVGCNDPRHYNNTYYFYKKGWRGLNIEPNSAKLRQFDWMRSNDVNLNLGVSQSGLELDFYNFHEDTLSTFSKEVSDDLQEMGHRLKEIKKIKTLPLAAIFDQYLPNGTSIDFLTIDTEGYDMEVLKSNDWQKYRPNYILLESLEYKRDGSGGKLNSIFDEYLLTIGYEKVADTYLNSIYKKIS